MPRRQRSHPSVELLEKYRTLLTKTILCYQVNEESIKLSVIRKLHNEIIDEINQIIVITD